MITTPEELRHVAELQEKATEGPWEIDQGQIYMPMSLTAYSPKIKAVFWEDLDFIAASRSVPLAKLAALWEAVEGLLPDIAPPENEYGECCFCGGRPAPSMHEKDCPWDSIQKALAALKEGNNG